MQYLPLVSSYSLAVTWRQYLVWRKLIWPALATNVANPVLLLFAFGFGLGRFIDTVDGFDYLAFVVPGMIAYSALFSASFETTIGSFTRYHVQRNWNAVLATPVTLAELLAGEVLWAALKGMLSAVCVLVVGWMWGGIPSPGGALLSLPVVFVASVGFACYGLVATALARGYEFFAYFFTFWVTPMFVFSGVFFEMDRFPQAVQVLAWILPLSHLLAVIRPLSTGAALDPGATALHLGYTVVLTAVAFYYAHRRASQRLFD